MTTSLPDGRRSPDRRQHRPLCPECGRWRRVDHNCPGAPAAPREAAQQHRVDPILGMRCVA